MRLFGAMILLCFSLIGAMTVFGVFDSADSFLPAASGSASESQSSGTSTASAVSSTTEAVTTTSKTTTEKTSEKTTSSKTSQTSKTTTTTAKTTTTKKTTTTTTTTTTTAAAVTGENAKYVTKPNYQTDYYIVVFTGSQSIVVYGKDETGAYNVPVKCFTCSTGTNSTPTYQGLYAIHKQYRWRLLMGGVYGQYSSAFSKGYLFHSVPYRTTDPSTLYENSYNKLGKKASHGCVRLCVRDAKWIYDNCEIGTQVYVTTAKGPAGAGVPALVDKAIYNGWDPSDPDPRNPYLTNPPDGTTQTTTTTATSTTTTTTSTTTTTATTTVAETPETSASTTATGANGQDSTL